jgi:hypothetical protein
MGDVMNPADAQLFVALTEGVARDFASMSKDKRAQAVSDMIRSAHIAYAVWKVPEGYRLRRLKALDGPVGEPEFHAGIPVDNEAHADLLEAAASHGAMRGMLQ